MPKKRPLNDGNVTSLPAFVEERRMRPIRKAAKEVLALPPEARTEVLKSLVTIKTSWPKKPGG
jgi:hypothetical protein